MIRFLADENCDFAVVRALRARGYDVAAVAETWRGIEDRWVLRWAQREGRIVLTEDKDFGRWIYAGGMAGVGVILLRYPATARMALCADLLNLIERQTDKLQGAFVVMRPGKVRIRRRNP